MMNNKRKNGGNTQLVEAKRRAIANAKRYGVAKAVDAEVKKSMTAKVSKGGSNLTFTVRNVWTARDDAKGSEPGGVTPMPTLRNTKIICRLNMPSDEDIEANPEMSKFTDDDGGFGVQFTGYVSDTTRQRARDWNNARTQMKKKTREELKAAATMSDEQIEAHLSEVYGEDISFDGYAERLYVNRDNWLSLPDEVGYQGAPGCVGASKVLNAQAMDVFSLTGVKYSYWLPELKDAAKAVAEYAARFADSKHGPKHALPSARPSVFLKSSGAKMQTVREETVLEALRLLDDAKPGKENEHLVHWLPSLADLAELDDSYYGPIMQRFTSAPNYERFGESSGMVTRVSLDTNKVLAGGNDEAAQFPLAKLFVSPTQWRESEEQTQFIEMKMADALEKAHAEGITDEQEVREYTQEALEMAKVECAFDPEKSEGFQYGINLSLYSRHIDDRNKSSQLSSCPVACPTAWSAFASTLFSGDLDFCVAHKIAVKDSEAHPANNDYKKAFDEASNAERFKRPMFVLTAYPSRTFFNWAQIVQNKCVPLSAAGAKALYESTTKYPQYAALQNDANIVKALNELHESQIATYFTGAKRVPVASCTEPRYAFFALVPYTFDDRAREVFATMRDAYANDGYDGAMGEVLLDESYTAEDAAAMGAHPALIESKMSRVPLNGDQLASLYVLVVDMAELHKVTSPEMVRTCMKEMFGIFQEEKEEEEEEEVVHTAEAETAAIESDTEEMQD